MGADGFELSTPAYRQRAVPLLVTLLIWAMLLAGLPMMVGFNVNQVTSLTIRKAGSGGAQ